MPGKVGTLSLWIIQWLICVIYLSCFPVHNLLLHQITFRPCDKYEPLIFRRPMATIDVTSSFHIPHYPRRHRADGFMGVGSILYGGTRLRQSLSVFNVQLVNSGHEASTIGAQSSDGRGYLRPASYINYEGAPRRASGSDRRHVKPRY